mgnify:CR=1 FL=1|tara:strand:+ start:437 stop:844 length:408 start_codon:yes stop_codon:yes gene_type:complete
MKGSEVIALDLEIVKSIKSPESYPSWFNLEWVLTKYFKKSLMLGWTEEGIKEWQTRGGKVVKYKPSCHLFVTDENAGGSYDDNIESEGEVIGSWYVCNGCISGISIYGFSAKMRDWEKEYLNKYNEKHCTNFIIA